MQDTDTGEYVNLKLNSAFENNNTLSCVSKQSREKQQASRRLSSLYINKHLGGKDGDY